MGNIIGICGADRAAFWVVKGGENGGENDQDVSGSERGKLVA